METIVNKIYLLIIAYGAAMFYLSYDEHNTALEELRAEAPALEAKIRKEKKKAKEIQKFNKDIERSKAEVEFVTQEVEKLQRLLPSELSDNENINLLKSFADEVNLKNVEVSPVGDESRGFYIVRSYNLTGVGTFLQFLVFFEKLAENERLINVGKVHLRKTKEKQRGRFQLIDGDIIIEAYKYNKQHKENTGIDEIEAEIANPKQPAKKKKPKKGRKK